MDMVVRTVRPIVLPLLSLLLGGCAPQFLPPHPPQPDWRERPLVLEQDGLAPVRTRQVVLIDRRDPRQQWPELLPTERVRWLAAVDYAAAGIQGGALARHGQPQGEIPLLLAQASDRAAGAEGTVEKVQVRDKPEAAGRRLILALADGQLSPEADQALRSLQPTPQMRLRVEFWHGGPLEPEVSQRLMGVWQEVVRRLYTSGFQRTQILVGDAKYRQGQDAIVLEILE